MKSLAAAAIIAVLGLSFIASFIFQTNYEQKVRDTIFAGEEERAGAYARSVAENIRSDMEGLMTRIDYLAQSKLIQDGETSGPRADAFLRGVRDESSQVASIDGITILDENDIIENYNSPTLEQGKYVGEDGSQTPAIVQFTDNLRMPTLTTGYASPFDGSFRIALLHPINDINTGEYKGTIATALVLETFMKQYGNVENADLRYISLIDKNFTVLASPFKETIGLNYFDPAFQQDITPQADEHFSRVFSGQSHTGVYSYRTGERLNAGEPIIIDGKAEYYVFIVTPTAAIYEQIDSVLYNQRMTFYMLGAGIAGAVVLLLYYLIRWNNTLEKAVVERTRELEKSNTKLAATTVELREANIQLKAHDQMQKEFINIAAHELRTPIQPILTMTEVIGASLGVEEEVSVSRQDIRIIGRNAARLERLSSDILDISRIESGSFQLTKDSFDMNVIVHEVVNEYKRYGDIEEVKMAFESACQPLNVIADKYRIMQVITNLLNNAIDFAKPSGSILITLQSRDDMVMVGITDTGPGISKDMMPRLFTKFATSRHSESGTGVGLYICKAIIEAHGGTIRGDNNRNGVGAIFTFMIPMNTRTEARRIAEK